MMMWMDSQTPPHSQSEGSREELCRHGVRLCRWETLNKFLLRQSSPSISQLTPAAVTSIPPQNHPDWSLPCHGQVWPLRSPVSHHSQICSSKAQTRPFATCCLQEKSTLLTEHSRPFKVWFLPLFPILFSMSFLHLHSFRQPKPFLSHSCPGDFCIQDFAQAFPPISAWPGFKAPPKCHLFLEAYLDCPLKSHRAS